MFTYKDNQYIPMESLVKSGIVEDVFGVFSRLPVENKIIVVSDEAYSTFEQFANQQSATVSSHIVPMSSDQLSGDFSDGMRGVLKSHVTRLFHVA